jgi:hypothetical protein
MREFEKYWEDEKNWHMGVYRCKDDKRLIVPKKPKWAGMTLNFAHRRAAWTVLLGTIGLASLPSIIFIAVYGPRSVNTVGFWLMQSLVVGAIVAFYYLARIRVR